jgi:hypothetical protein
VQPQLHDLDDNHCVVTDGTVLNQKFNFSSFRVLLSVGSENQAAENFLVFYSDDACNKTLPDVPPQLECSPLGKACQCEMYIFDRPANGFGFDLGTAYTPLPPSGLPLSAIVGIAVGSAALLIVAVIIAIAIWNKKKRIGYDRI